VQVLTKFGFNPENLTEDLFLQEDKIIRLGNPPLRIKIMMSISGIDFESCYKDRVKDNFDGIPVKLISLHDLKKNKKAANRYKYLDDLEILQ